LLETPRELSTWATSANGTTGGRSDVVVSGGSSLSSRIMGVLLLREATG